MTPKYTNKNGVPLSLAVWLMNDTYDYVKDPYYISATSLLKPTRMIILGNRVENVPDLSDLITSRIGTAVHDAIEKAWVNKDLTSSLGSIGFPPEVAERIVINPKEVKEGDIPVYIEQRGYYKYGKYTVGGKFDICIDGYLEDFKNTSVYAYIFGSRDDEFIKQGSIYRFINQDIVTKNTFKINYIFKDFQESKINTDRNYPPTQALVKEFPLISISATRELIHNKIDEIDRYRDADEADLPLCSDEDLWKTKYEYAYYKNPAGARATKIYDTLEEANARLNATGEGKVEIRGGEPKRCNYCTAQPICSQYKRMMEI